MGVTSKKIKRVIGSFNLKYLVIATIRSSNMKSFAMASFVFFIVAITMIAMASGGIMGVCEEWADETGECSKRNDAEACCREQGVPDLCFGYCLPGQLAKQRQLKSVGGLCGQWCDQIEECFEGTEDYSLACCKNKGVPFDMPGNCRPAGGVCGEWIEKVSECRESNDGKACCEGQGVPEGCSAYCET